MRGRRRRGIHIYMYIYIYRYGKREMYIHTFGFPVGGQANDTGDDDAHDDDSACF
jgi:hypothetical protein